MQYLRVKNWEEFQHYKDRNPPWIKLHRKVLDDYGMACLQDASRLHLMLIWVLASQMDNRIPYDATWVQNRIGAKTRVNIKELIDKGFLLLEHDASAPIADCPPETEAEAETEDVIKKRGAKLSLDDLSLEHNAEWLFKKRQENRYLNHDEGFILEKFKNYCKSKGKVYADYLAGYRNAFDWESCQPKASGAGKPTKDERARNSVLKAAVAGGYASSQRHGGATTLGDATVSGIPGNEDLRQGTGKP